MSSVAITPTAREGLRRLQPEDRRAVTNFLKRELVDFAETEDPRRLKGIERPVWVARVKGGPLTVFEEDPDDDRYVVLAIVPPLPAFAGARPTPWARPGEADVGTSEAYELGEALMTSIALHPPPST